MRWHHARAALASTKCVVLGVQMLSVMIPGGAFVLPVRSLGRVRLAKRPGALSSADLARQLLHSAGFEDIQAAQLTSLQGFSRSLPGAARPLAVLPACRSTKCV